MLFLLVEMKRLLDFFAEALAIGGTAVAAMLFFVDVASTTSLCRDVSLVHREVDIT